MTLKLMCSWKDMEECAKPSSVPSPRGDCTCLQPAQKDACYRFFATEVDALRWVPAAACPVADVAAVVAAEDFREFSASLIV